ncbi:MAG: 16S rRNA (cytosine(967)-C(5))-methyltransferase RsmB [Pseudomonadales bacterium]
MKESATNRAHAANALNHVIYHNRTIDWVIQNQSDEMSTPLVSELVYGVCRYYFSLSQLLDARLKKPLRDKDSILYCLLLVGAYQLLRTDIKSHAVVNETVNACGLVKRPWARGMVNGVLRNIQRASPEHANSPDTEQSFELPAWLHDMLKIDYGADFAELATANLQRAPMTLRINQRNTDRETYLASLTSNDISYATHELPYAVTLNQPMATARLPGWSTGQVAVQDYGAQLVGALATRLLSNSDTPQHVLDACCAPGGKLFHLLEHTTTSQVASMVALEVSESRAQSTEAIAQRLGHKLPIVRGDAGALDWWDERPFSFILLDAPCSGTGTLRRHPDIKLLLTPEQVTEHARKQLQLLENLWSTLAVGGTLLYCTCSLLAVENDNVIERFLADTHQADKGSRDEFKSTAEVLDVNSLMPFSTGRATQFGWQLLPTDINTDGFYMALLKKVSTPAMPRSSSTAS